MKLVPVETLPKSKRGEWHGKYTALIEQFLKMDVKTVRIENTYVDAGSICKSINDLIKRNGIKGVRAVTRDKIVYLTKEV